MRLIMIKKAQTLPYGLLLAILLATRPFSALGQTKLDLQPNTDVTAELQQAIDTCSYFCTLTIPPGSYFIGDILIRKSGSLRIVGAGKESTVLTYIASGTAFQTVPQSGRIPIAFEDLKAGCAASRGDRFETCLR